MTSKFSNLTNIPGSSSLSSEEISRMNEELTIPETDPEETLLLEPSGETELTPQKKSNKWPIIIGVVGAVILIIIVIVLIVLFFTVFKKSPTPTPPAPTPPTPTPPTPGPQPPSPTPIPPPVPTPPGERIYPALSTNPQFLINAGGIYFSNGDCTVPIVANSVGWKIINNSSNGYNLYFDYAAQTCSDPAIPNQLAIGIIPAYTTISWNEQPMANGTYGVPYIGSHVNIKAFDQTTPTYFSTNLSTPGIAYFEIILPEGICAGASCPPDAPHIEYRYYDINGNIIFEYL